MTTTTTTTTTKPRRRWHRAVIPFAVVATLLIVTGVTYGLEQPDQSDAAFLSPVSDAGIGASRLAGRVRAAGITVQRETRTAAALDAADGDATLLLPAPSLVHREYLRLLPLLPSGTRIVLVEPRSVAVRRGDMPVTLGSRRWATAVPAPSDGGGCELEPALRAGPAAVTRQRYGDVGAGAAEVDRCYGGGLVVLRWGGVELVLAGASDPFRNDRIAEHGNAALATGLLTARPRLVWLDLHTDDPPPRPTPGAEDPARPEPDSTNPPGEDGAGSGDGGRGDGGEPGSGDGGQGDGRGDGRGDEGSDDRADSRSQDEGNPLLDAFPPWVWAVLAQIALAALLLTLWRARRLGPPVAEPLPVTVRSAETVRGRGRLYQRARARGPALDIVRAATRARLAALLKLPPGAEADALAAAVATRTGRDPAEVEALLAGPAPIDDDDLVRMARDLETLPHAVRGEER